MIREAETDTNQPSSGTMRICIGTCPYITSICAITELRETKVIDSIKDEANEIIVIIIIIIIMIIIKNNNLFIKIFHTNCCLHVKSIKKNY